MGLGWLFGTKKVQPKIPLPGSRPFDEKTFQFSKKFGKETLIEPEHLQAAAGFDKLFSFPEPAGRGAPPGPMMPSFGEQEVEPTALPVAKKPIYLKVNLYEKILWEVDTLKYDCIKLQQVNNHLETSEYNEEHHLEKLKKDLKALHDKLGRIDKVLFKYPGE
ncbi:hypothetical protein HZC30_00630 [Candidatus Woesearchaeota archaeon]|nr:hypothetical protein [Candidatus Woesearchaeota archaeon]